MLQRVDLLLVFLAVFISFLLYSYYGPVQEKVQLPPPAEEVALASAEAAEEEPPATPDTAAPVRRSQAKAGTPVRFLMYNVHDYFVAQDPKRSRHARKLKPLEQREAVAQVIASVRPEVVGLVEIGGPAALDDLADRLAARGLTYPHRKVLTRMTEDRALGLLSMHPIVADHSVENCKLVGNSSRPMLRGILDISVQPEGDPRVFRIMGVHLKSRVGDDPIASESLRAREARTLADRLARVLRKDPDAAILIYGDWNDGPKDPALSVFANSSTYAGGVRRLNPKDANGEGWTFYYRDGQEYNTFDQIYVSPALHKRIGRKSEQGIVRQPERGAQPSDHRAVWCDMR